DRAVRLQFRHAAFNARHHLVADADVCEGAAHHDVVAAAPRAVGVEFTRPHLIADQVLAGRALDLDAAGRPDAVSRDARAENRQSAGAGDVADRARLLRHILEIGRQSEIRRTVVEFIGHPARAGDLAPFRRSFENIAVAPLEFVARYRARDGLGDLLVARPDVAEIDRLAVIALAEHVSRQIGADRAG